MLGQDQRGIPAAQDGSEARLQRAHVDGVRAPVLGSAAQLHLPHVQLQVQPGGQGQLHALRPTHQHARLLRGHRAGSGLRHLLHGGRHGSVPAAPAPTT